MTVALVTGANRGIGLETCRQLAARGATVIAASRRGAPHPHGEAITLDVSDPRSVRSAAAMVAERHRGIDVLVNNAAIYLDEDVPVTETTTELLRETLATNLERPLRVTQAFWPLLRDGGRVVNVSSMSGQFAQMDNLAPAYSISKSALNALTVQFAFAGRERGIRVNCVCPGWVRTDMGGPRAPRKVEDGAAGIVWLALDAPAKHTGRFFRDGKVIPW